MKSRKTGNGTERGVLALFGGENSMARAKEQDKKKNLDLTLKSIEKQFGRGSIMRLGDPNSVWREISTIPSGSISLDVALGIGGYPRGRIVEIYGPEASGKTTLALHALAETQKLGGTAAFIDAEHALDMTYAGALGVDTEELLVSQPDTWEQALEIADMLIRSNSIDMLVIDSVAALTPRAELEGEMGDSHVGLQARLMSQAMRKLTASIAKSRCCMVFINQIRMKIGVMFGSPETTTGGRALKFYASCRLDVRRIGSIKSGQDIIGNRTRVKVVKNKLAPPFREAEFDIVYGKGISNVGDSLDLGTDIGLIDKSGSWYSYEGERLGQGRQNAIVTLAENSEMFDGLFHRLREHFELIKPDPDAETAEAKTAEAKTAEAKTAEAKKA